MPMKAKGDCGTLISPSHPVKPTEIREMDVFTIIAWLQQSISDHVLSPVHVIHKLRVGRDEMTHELVRELDSCDSCACFSQTDADLVTM
jgi:hypothetical protein